MQTLRTHRGPPRAVAWLTCLALPWMACTCTGEEGGLPAPLPLFPGDTWTSGGAPGRPSRSTPVDVLPDGSLVLAAFRDGNTVAVFRADQSPVHPLVLTWTTGLDRPSGVLFHPDGRGVLFVDAHGLHVADNALAPSPTPEAIPTCAGPEALVTSPSGRVAYVGCVDGHVVAVDTVSRLVLWDRDLRVPRSADAARVPPNAGVMAMAVTHDGDADDNDETLVVPMFWAEPLAVRRAEEADLAGMGVVLLLDTSGHVRARVDLPPQPMGAFGVGSFMNQLSAVTVDRGRAYVAALAASPRGPPGPAVDTDGVPAGGQNVFPMVSVVDLATATETRRLDLNGLIRSHPPPNHEWTNLSSLSALAFVPWTRRLVVVSVAADALLPLELAEDDRVVTVGRVQDLVAPQTTVPTSIYAGAGARGPVGVAVGPGPSMPWKTLWVNGEISQSLLPLLDDGASAVGTSVMTPVSVEGLKHDTPWARGKHFFFTSSGRWGARGMVGCLACHPGGGALSDNVTWFMGPGPRQTPPLDSLFGKVGDVAGGEPDPADHRAQNWTANFDEVADLEPNTRNVSGGFGALYVRRPDGFDRRIDLDAAPVLLDGGLGPITGLRNSSDRVCRYVSASPDWLEMAGFLATLRAPRAPTPDAARVARGRALFQSGNCALCHGGSKWSSSRVPYDPTHFVDGVPSAESAHAVVYGVDGGTPFNTGGLVISGDDVPWDEDAGIPRPSMERIACVLRNVGTFLVDGGVHPLEVRSDMRAENRAQGVGGYNPPSLMGLHASAPYLHRGQARTLEELFTRGEFLAHTTAGNPAFSLPGASEVDDLVAFLLSIDDTTEVIPPPAGYNLCPRIF